MWQEEVTCVHAAAFNNHLEAVVFLALNGAEINSLYDVCSFPIPFVAFALLTLRQGKLSALDILCDDRQEACISSMRPFL